MKTSRETRSRIAFLAVPSGAGSVAILLGVVLSFILIALSTPACDTWKAADAKSSSDAARLEALLEARCSPAGVDAGSCDPAAVRALERGAYCANASMLGRRGVAAPDAGIRCQP